MYVHATGLAINGPLAENDRVSFASEVDRRTNKPKAVKVVLSAAVEAPAPPAEEEPVAESLVETIMESVRDELDVYEIKIRAEAFQRARLATQLRMAAAEALASRVAEERRLEEEAIAASAAAEGIEDGSALDPRFAAVASAAAAASAALDAVALQSASASVAGGGGGGGGGSGGSGAGGGGSGDRGNSSSSNSSSPAARIAALGDLLSHHRLRQDSSGTGSGSGRSTPRRR